MELLKSYELYLQSKNYKPRGIEEKLRMAKVFLNYLDSASLSVDITVRKAEEYREYLTLSVNDKGDLIYSAGSINGIIANLRLFYTYLIEERKSHINPFMQIEKLKEPSRLPKNILTEKQLGIFLNSLSVESNEDLQFKAVIELLYSTGARINEIEKLTTGDINIDKGYIQIKNDKNRQDRKGVLTEYCKSVLKEYLKDCKEKEPFRHGSARSLNKWVNDRLKRVSKSLNLPVITCHSFRHMTGTHLLKNGADIREVQNYLGHLRIKNTEIYIRVIGDDLKNAIDKYHPRERLNEVE